MTSAEGPPSAAPPGRGGARPAALSTGRTRVLALAGAAVLHLLAFGLLHGLRGERVERPRIVLARPTVLRPPPSLAEGGGGRLGGQPVPPSPASRALPVPAPVRDTTVAAQPARSASSRDVTASPGTGGGTGGGSGTGSGTGVGSGSGAGTPAQEETFDPARLISIGVWPRYPPSARRSGIRGSVQLSLHVRMDGLVDSALVTRGMSPAEFNREAVETALRLRFEPARRNGVAIATWVPYTVTFDRP